MLDEALDWLVRLKAGAPAQTDLDTFLCWRQQSDAHEQAFRAAVRLYHLAMVAIKELAEEETTAAHDDVSEAQQQDGQLLPTFLRRW